MSEEKKVQYTVKDLIAELREMDANRCAMVYVAAAEVLLDHVERIDIDLAEHLAIVGLKVTKHVRSGTFTKGLN